MIVFADLATSGLMKRELPKDHAGQPWAVAIACELTDADGASMAQFYSPIRADGRKITEGAKAVHGISDRDAGKNGINEIVALGCLCAFASQAKYVVGFGIDFDRDIVESLLMRRNKDTKLWTRPGLEFVDVMKIAAHACKILPKEPRPDGQWKWPSMEEACTMLLGAAPPAQANNWELLQLVKRLFFVLRDRKLFEVAA
jgi:hypothetical protein